MYSHIFVHQIVESGYDAIEGHGAASAYELSDVERLFQLLLADDILGEHFQVSAVGFTNSYLKTGTKSQAVIDGRLVVNMAISAVTAKKVAPEKSKATKKPATSTTTAAKGSTNTNAGTKKRAAAPIVYQSNEFVDDSDGDSQEQATMDNDSDPATKPLVELTSLRQRDAKGRGVPVDSIVSDEVLHMLALMLPTTVSAFKSYVHCLFSSFPDFIHSRCSG